METDAERRSDWAGMPVIATGARPLCRDDPREEHPDTRRDRVTSPQAEAVAGVGSGRMAASRAADRDTRTQVPSVRAAAPRRPSRAVPAAERLSL
jgi:hypothetical protein